MVNANGGHMSGMSPVAIHFMFEPGRIYRTSLNYMEINSPNMHQLTLKHLQKQDNLNEIYESLPVEEIKAVGLPNIQ
jgi:hypothetical protein